jgi:hypothetical protein
METGHTSRVTSSQPITHPRPRPKPRPVFEGSKGKKRKIADLSNNSQASEENKRNRSSQGRLSNLSPIVAPVEDIWQALIAQRNPQPAAISGLRKCSLTSIWCLPNYFSPHSVVSHPIPVVSHQTIGNTYLSPMCN